MILDKSDRFLFDNRGNHVFINVNICKNLNMPPEVFCCFPTDFDQGKNMDYFVTIVYNLTSGNALNAYGLRQWLRQSHQFDFWSQNKS